MVIGIFEKIGREMTRILLGFVLSLGAATALITLILPQFQEGFADILAQIPFIQVMVSSILGIDISADGGLTPKMMLAIAWSHPIVLTLLWAYEIVHCTRFPAGEVDRGTIEILLGWPVSRRTLYLAESIAWLVAGLLLILSVYVGYWLGARAIEPGNRPAFSSIALVAINLFCLYFAVGGIAYLISSYESHRGRAMATVFGIAVASYLLNFLASFWAPAESLAFLSLLHYYQPGEILLERRLPVDHVAALLGAGIVAWAIGALVVLRRNLGPM